MDVDLRKLRYFVAVAERLHFGRAAEDLHVAQPMLSRQIRVLEHELRAQLFVRDKRTTTLTPAGTQLLTDARPLLANAEALRRRVGRAARGTRTFTVGFMPGLIVTPAVRAMAAAHPELTMDVVRTGWDDQTDVIRDGRVDVSYVRMPVDHKGLRLAPLFTEPRVAVVPADHRLAGKENIALADLAGERTLQNPDAIPEWRDIVVERRGDGLVLGTVEEKLEHVAAGDGVVILPLSVVSYYSRPDVVSVRVRDLADNQVCLAWDSTRRSGLIHSFAAIAASYGNQTTQKQDTDDLPPRR